MAQTTLRGSTQIKDGTIPLTKLVTGYSIPTANLAEGASFFKRDGSVVPTANLPMGGFRITGLADAVSDQDATNLRTVMALVNGVTVRSVRAVIATNAALTGVQNPAGLTGAALDEILLIGQTNAAQNGPWIMNSGAWTRPAWWAAASTQKATLVLVREGTTYGDTKFICVTDGNIIVDTTTTTWVQDSSGATYANGNGLSLVGNVFAVRVGQGIQFDGSQNIQVQLDGASLSRSGSGIKIADGTAGQILMANAGGAATYTAVSGDATISNTGVVTVSVNTTTGFLKYTNAVINEIPSGAINGSNNAYTLANTPVSGTVALYANGQRLRSGAGNDYTISGANITMLFTLQTDDVLLADYLK